MTPTVATAVWMLLALVGAFAVVIYFSLRARKASFANNLHLRAQDLFPSLGTSDADFANLVYGVWRDKSSTHLELLVRDSRDQELASIVFHTLSREPAFTIELGGTSLRSRCAGKVSTDYRSTPCRGFVADALHVSRVVRRHFSIRGVESGDDREQACTRSSAGASLRI